MAKIVGEAPPVRHGSDYTVQHAIRDYLESLKLNSTTASETLSHYPVNFLSRNGVDGANRALSGLTREDFGVH